MCSLLQLFLHGECIFSYSCHSHSDEIALPLEFPHPFAPLPSCTRMSRVALDTAPRLPPTPLPLLLILPLPLSYTPMHSLSGTAPSTSSVSHPSPLPLACPALRLRLAPEGIPSGPSRDSAPSCASLHPFSCLDCKATPSEGPGRHGRQAGRRTADGGSERGKQGGAAEDSSSGGGSERLAQLQRVPQASVQAPPPAS